MSVLTHKKCLVLNKGWTAVGTVSLKRAMTMVFGTHPCGEPKAKIICHETFQTFTWDDWSQLRPSVTDEALRSANLAFRIPEVIILSKYDRLPQPKVHFSRRTLYKRDNHTCQYCLKKLDSESCTIDHIVPRSKGGLTTWENCCIACVKCNAKKANRTLKEAGMKLHCVPKKPAACLFKCDTIKMLESWKGFISEAYYNVELQNDNED